MDKIGSYSFLAEPFHCDFTGRLFMGHLGNHLLNAADFHSTDRGFGMQYLNTIHKTWVLSRLAIEMEEMPPIYTRFRCETWIENAMRYFTNRNFRVLAEDASEQSGENPSEQPSENPSEQPSENASEHTTDGQPHVYGYGRSVWALIDTESRQPQDLMAINDGSIVNWIDADKPCPIEKGSRVKMSHDASLVRTIDTYYHDVDINGHINSVKYIEHVLDLWGQEWYAHHTIKRFEIAYVAESHQGDRLRFYLEQTGAQSSAQSIDLSSAQSIDLSGAQCSDYTSEMEYCIRITKLPQDGSDEVEVCRSKVLFRGCKSRK